MARILFFGFLLGALVQAKAETKLKVHGSTTVNPIVLSAAEVFKERGWKVLIDTQGGSSGGITYVAKGFCDIGMSSRAIVAKDRQKFPKADFKVHTIGYDGVALVVNKFVYEAGVKDLTKQQIRAIYEGRITNWKTVGGPDLNIVFFNKEPGRGTWEVFKKFVYSKEKPPKVFHPEVGSNQETLSKVSQLKGAITQLSASWAWEAKDVKALAIRKNSGTVAPTPQTIADGSYPMQRPLTLITNGEPVGTSAEFIRYLRGVGQKHVKENGYLTLKEIKNGSKIN